MLWLPELCVDGVRIRLPMAERTAMTISELVLSGGLLDVRHVSQRLAADPGFILWCAIRAQMLDSSAIWTRDNAIEWLADHAETVFSDWVLPPKPESGSDPSSTGQSVGTVGPYSFCVRRSLRYARTASTLAKVDGADTVVMDRAYLAGMFAVADEWLRRCCLEECSAKPTAEALDDDELPTPAYWTVVRAIPAFVPLRGEDRHDEAPGDDRAELPDTEPSPLELSPDYAEVRKYVDEAALRIRRNDPTDQLVRSAEQWSSEIARKWVELVPDAGRLLKRVVQHAQMSALSHANAVAPEPPPITDAGPLDMQTTVPITETSGVEPQTPESLEQAKMSALAEFAAGAGHDINNPLAIIGGRAQLLLENETDPQRRNDLAMIHAQVQRTFEMIADIRLFARPPQPEPEPVDLVKLVDRLVDDLEQVAGDESVELQRIGEQQPVLGLVDPLQARVALDAICRNAIEAIRDLHDRQGGRIELECRRVEADDAAGDDTPGDSVNTNSRWVEIVIKDDGPGIPAELRSHIFDPFYSSRQAGRGLGFGLSKAWRIVTLHGGAITVDPQPGEGATFIVRLPGV